MPNFVERVAAEAPKVKPGKALIAVLSFPFYLLGWIAGLLIVAALFMWGGFKLGVKEARAKATPAVDVPERLKAA